MQNVPKYNPTLVQPTETWYSEWLEAMDEFKLPYQEVQGASVFDGDDMSTREGFAAWVKKMADLADPEVPNPVNLVDHTQYLVIDESHGKVLGFVSLRHALNAYLREFGGNVGYSIRPSARRQGLATWALNAVKAPARELGLNKILVTCDQGNEGSRRTIEQCGGVLENICLKPEGGMLRRYWVAM